MDFLQILDLPVQPGGLVEWTPTLGDGATALRSDPRPTSHNHERHLREALAYQEQTGYTGGRESWLGVAIEFDEPLSIPAIRAALTAWIDRHEVLRSHVVFERGDNGSVGVGRLRRYSAGPGSVSLTMSRIGWYHDSGPLIEQVAGWFDRSTAPIRWPAYCFATVGRQDSFTLLFAGDHSLLDGYSLIMMVPELRTLYHDATAGSERTPHRPAPGRRHPPTPSAAMWTSALLSATTPIDPPPTTPPWPRGRRSWPRECRATRLCPDVLQRIRRSPVTDRSRRTGSPWGATRKARRPPPPPGRNSRCTRCWPTTIRPTASPPSAPVPARRCSPA